MSNEVNHRELAEHFLREAKTEPNESAIACAPIAIGHAVLAQQEPSFDEDKERWWDDDPEEAGTSVT